MNNYIRELSLGELISSAFALYRRNVGTLMLFLAVPLAPFYIASAYMSHAQLIGEHWLVYTLLLAGNVVLQLLLTGLATVLISDVCMGNQPRLGVAARYVVTSAAGRLTVVSLLQIGALVAGTLFFVVPAIAFASWFVVAPVVVTLEGLGGRRALRRSKQLGKGYYIRTLVLIAVLAAIGTVIGGVLGGVAGFFGEIFAPGSPWPILLATGGAQAMVAPLPIVAVVLIYYDLRVRKEGFNTVQLSEELRL